MWLFFWSSLTALQPWLVSSRTQYLRFSYLAKKYNSNNELASGT
jgi:hypothetical protein